MPETWTLSLAWLRLPRSASPRDAISAGGEISDEALFERVCRADDHAAFGELVNRYRARITMLVRRMLSARQTAIDPDDLAQEAFVEAYRRRGTFRTGSPLRPWLYGIAVNRCVDRLRAQQREMALGPLPSGGEEAVASADKADDPLSSLLRRQDATYLQQAVGALPSKLRVVLILRYLDDLSYEEIAAVCSLPIGTVKTTLFRARAELKRRLENARED